MGTLYLNYEDSYLWITVIDVCIALTKKMPICGLQWWVIVALTTKVLMCELLCYVLRIACINELPSSGLQWCVKCAFTNETVRNLDWFWSNI